MGVRAFYEVAFVKPPKQRCVDLTDSPGRLFGTLFRAQTRDLPPRVIRFPHLQRRGHPTSARVADQTVERDGRQAMPRAEPALPQVATLRLPAVVGAATLRGRESPHP